MARVQVHLAIKSSCVVEVEVSDTETIDEIIERARVEAIFFQDHPVEAVVVKLDEGGDFPTPAPWVH
jgi:hypothetical protein